MTLHHGTPPAPFLRTSLVLPLFDSIFAVALTLLAFAIPDDVMSTMDVDKLAVSVGIYLLSGLTVLIFWFKLRRLLYLSRSLNAVQSSLGLSCLLVIVLLPKLGQLVVLHGSGSGDFQNWTPAQIVNTIFLGALLLFDLLCVGLGLSLTTTGRLAKSTRQRLRLAIRYQVCGFAVLLFFGILELAVSWFNSQYVFLVPIVLLLEEWLTAARFASI